MQRFSLLFLVIFVACAGTPKLNEEVGAVDDKQVEALQENVSANSSDYSSYYQLAQLTVLKGDINKGIFYLDSALMIRSDYSEARFLKGKLLYESGRLKESYQEFLLLLEQDTGDFYVRKIGSTIGVLYSARQIRISNNDDANPHYDPSGNRIVFQSNVNGNWDLFLINRTGGDLQQLTKSQLNDEAPIFGSQNIIYFTRQQSATSDKRDIYSYDIAKKTVNSIIQHPADDWYLAPARSSNWLFFVSDREIDNNNNSKIFGIDPDSKEIKPILVSKLNFSSPSLHPLLDEFLFTVKDDIYYSLYQSNFSGRGLRKLTSRNLNFGAPKFSPDGKKVIFFSKSVNNFDIFELNIQSKELIRLTGHPENDLSPNYSPDGKKIIFYSNRTGKYQIFELNLELPASRVQLLDRLRLAVRENKFQ